MVQILYKTKMTNIPNNCISCNMCLSGICSLPDKKTGSTIKKKYLKERHKDCPLVEVDL